MTMDIHLGTYEGFDFYVTYEAHLQSSRFPPADYLPIRLNGEFAAFQHRTDAKVYVHPDLVNQLFTLTKD